jgi:cytochrome c553
MAGLAAEFPGTICFPNITADRASGVGAWTDGELLRAVREGVDRDGHALFPIMPYFIFRNLSEEDARSLVVWIRSLPAVSRQHPAKQVNFPVNLFIRFVPQPMTAKVPEPDPANSVAYGKYLATIGRCGFCHSPREGQSTESIPGRLFAGGNEFRGPFGIRLSTNLTPHPSGLGSTSREEFIALFRLHATPGSVLPEKNTIMAWSAYSGMTDADLGALYDYLRTVPPVASSPG